MNWTYHINKHYSAEHLHKVNKVCTTVEAVGEREKPVKKVRSKRHPRQRR
jgi:hypothetical protein